VSREKRNGRREQSFASVNIEFLTQVGILLMVVVVFGVLYVLPPPSSSDLLVRVTDKMFEACWGPLATELQRSECFFEVSTAFVLFLLILAVVIGGSVYLGDSIPIWLDSIFSRTKKKKE